AGMATRSSREAVCLTPRWLAITLVGLILIVTYGPTHRQPVGAGSVFASLRPLPFCLAASLAPGRPRPGGGAAQGRGSRLNFSKARPAQSSWLSQSFGSRCHDGPF